LTEVVTAYVLRLPLWTTITCYLLLQKW